MGEIAIAGAATTKFGVLPDVSLEQLITEAGNEAISDAGIKNECIDAVFVGNMLSGELQHQEHLGALATSVFGIHCPALKVEGACASGSLAVHTAIQYLKAGTYETVLVIGAEKMTNVPPEAAREALMGAASQAERQQGYTFPGLYAEIAKAHMAAYQTTREHLAFVSVKNHYNATLNPKAQFQKEWSIDQVLQSTPLEDASPLTRLDACPISDGAAALVLATNPLRRKHVSISASAIATDSIDLKQRHSQTEFAATKQAAEKAYKQAGVEPEDVDVAEVHDCFTIAEILAMEDLGFCRKGEGGPFIETGYTTLGGKLPVNTSGGLKACGHPVGATGVKQIVEIYDQLLRRAGKRQVDKPLQTGLTHNVGGTGATAVVHILQV